MIQGNVDANDLPGDRVALAVDRGVAHAVHLLNDSFDLGRVYLLAADVNDLAFPP